MIDLSFWFMFPIAIGIATIAMLAGIGGALLFSPFFMLVLKLDPLLALGLSIFIEFFGFSSGVVGYWRQKAIRFDIVKRLIIFTVPATILGVMIGRLVPSMVLKSVLGLLLVYVAYQFIFNRSSVKTKKKMEVGPIIKASSFGGALLLGMVSSGLGEINEYNFLEKLKLKVSQSSGTSVFLVAMGAIVASFSHIFYLVKESSTVLMQQIAPILLFSVPGVIIGAQIGSRLSSHISIDHMKLFLGLLFSALGAMVFLAIML